MKFKHKKLLTQKEQDEVFSVEEPRKEDPITGYFECRECGARGIYQERLLEVCKCRTALISFIKDN